MKTLLLLVLLLRFLQQKLIAASCAGTWDPCGGKEYDDLTCCSQDDECKKFSRYYSQCVPKQNINNDVCSDTYETCGGKSQETKTCCRSGDTCVFISEWYSQCLADDGYNTGDSNTTGSLRDNEYRNPSAIFYVSVVFSVSMSGLIIIWARRRIRFHQEVYNIDEYNQVFVGSFTSFLKPPPIVAKNTQQNTKPDDSSTVYTSFS